MKSVTLSLVRSAANAFDFGGPVLCDAHHYGEGHINDTFVVWREDHSKRFILQRINTDTFTNPVGLMENVCGVTRPPPSTRPLPVSTTRPTAMPILKKPSPPMHWAAQRTLRRKSNLSMRGSRTAMFCWISWPLVRSRCVSPIMIPKSIMFCSMKPLAKASVSLASTP